MSLSPITSPLLFPARHGFFTRIGGVSNGVFKALNCGFGSPEDPYLIRENRALIADNIGVRAKDLLTATQTHSADVVTVLSAEEIPPETNADALVSNLPDVALGVLTADCAPVLFHDPTQNIIGAAHAGWRGAVGGVLEATIEAMCAIGAARQDIRAAVGPSISQANYEVGQDFFEDFFDRDHKNSEFFINGVEGKYQFDLPRFVLHQLKAQQIGAIEWTGHCTYAEPDRFYSYRYTKHNALPSYGRMLSVIAL